MSDKWMKYGITLWLLALAVPASARIIVCVSLPQSVHSFASRMGSLNVLPEVLNHAEWQCSDGLMRTFPAIQKTGILLHFDPEIVSASPQGHEAVFSRAIIDVRKKVPGSH